MVLILTCFFLPSMIGIQNGKQDAYARKLRNRSKTKWDLQRAFFFFHYLCAPTVM